MLGKVNLCGLDTSKLPVIPEGALKGYFERIRKGDEKAREEFIYGNLRLVLSMVQRFAGRGENMDDLFQIGCIGLIKAVENFNTELNVRFSTYAVPMILGELKRYLRDYTTIRVSRSLRDTAYHALQARSELSYEKGGEPTVEDIAARLGIAREDVSQALEAIQDPVSLYAPVFHDSNGEALYVMDQLKDESTANETWIESIALKDAVESLPERERSIIDLRFFEGKTQMEVAREIGISQAQVSRLEKAALKRIKGSYQ